MFRNAGSIYVLLSVRILHCTKRIVVARVVKKGLQALKYSPVVPNCELCMLTCSLFIQLVGPFDQCACIDHNVPFNRLVLAFPTILRGGARFRILEGPRGAKFPAGT